MAPDHGRAVTGTHERSRILEQAAEVNRLDSVLDDAFERRQRDPESWSRAAEAFKAALAAFYEPFERAAISLRVMKQKPLRRTARWARISGDRARLQDVVLRLRNPSAAE